MNYMTDFVQFCREAVQELKLVSWLPRAQMVTATFVVIIFSALMGLYVSAIDRALLFFAQILFRIG